MAIIEKHKFTLDGDRISLTRSPSPGTTPEDYDLMIDLTLNKSQHSEGKLSKRILDCSLERQRRYLLENYYDMLTKINIFERHFSISHIFVVYEIQCKTGNVHSHANIKIDCNPNYHEYAQATLSKYLAHRGFRQFTVQYIKYPLERWNYIMKAQSKFPNVVHTVRTSYPPPGTGGSEEPKAVSVANEPVDTFEHTLSFL